MEWDGSCIYFLNHSIQSPSNSLSSSIDWSSNTILP